MPRGQKFCLKLSPLSVGFRQRRPLSLIKRPQLVNSPGVHFINLKTTLRAVYIQPPFVLSIKLLHSQRKSPTSFCGGGLHLVAPYCAIPRDYLSDTPLLRAMGFLVSQHGQLGAIPPPHFLSVSPLEGMRSGGPIPPPQKKGYLSDTCAILYENKANGCDTPPPRYYLERVLRDMGGYLALGR